MSTQKNINQHGKLELQVVNEMEESIAMRETHNATIERIFKSNPKIERQYATEYREKVNPKYKPVDPLAYSIIANQ
jgi:hypothetical protein